MSLPPVYRADVAPTSFTIAIFIGGGGSAALSYLQVPALASVAFALLVMFALAAARLRVAVKFKDFQSLETFAEDIYLLGYLLTLAALLGLTKRLMSDEANLFHIAGLKLITTVVGLGLMMVFRQTARRWAAEQEREPLQKFEEQQRLFSDAIARVRQGADLLTAKLDEVITHFDPTLLIPVADWSNRAANTFSAAASALEKIPTTVDESIRAVKGLNTDLADAKAAAAGLAGVLSAGTAEAAKALATELAHTKVAAETVANSFTLVAPTGDAAKDSLKLLATEAHAGAAQVKESAVSLHRAATEATNMQEALKKLIDMYGADGSAPVNRLIDALQTSSTEFASAKAVLSHLIKSISQIGAELNGTSQQVQRLIERLDTAIDNKPKLFGWFSGSGAKGDR